MTSQKEPAAAPSSQSESRKSPRRLWLCLAILIAVAFIAHAGSLPNTAQLRHEPNGFMDPLLDSSFMKFQPLFPKIFGGEMVFTTFGEYRPLGYAFLAMMNRVIPEDAVGPRHIAFLLLHVATAVILFFLFRSLVGDWIGLGFACVYAAAPCFAPLLNDIYQAYFLWGLFFSVCTLLTFLQFARSSRLRYLFVSLLFFAAAAFSYEFAMALPAFLMAIWFWHETHRRALAVALAYQALIVLAAGVGRAPTWMTALGLFVATAILVSVASPDRKRLQSFPMALVPYLALLAAFLVVSSNMIQTPTQERRLMLMANAGLLAPYRLWFIARSTWLASAWGAAAMGLIVLAPVVLLVLRGTRRLALIGLIVVVSVFATILLDAKYADDVTYWDSVRAAKPGDLAVLYNLAASYLDAGKAEPARDLLLHLRYERDPPQVLREMLYPKLGRAFAMLGKEKVAGAFYFYLGAPSAFMASTMKRSCVESAAFFMEKGYIECAQNYYASSLVIDPYDARLYTKLGITLVYRNFFRAAERHFLHALELNPRDATPLYYLAFTSKTLGKDAEFDAYTRRWQALTRASGPPDFAPIFARYHFEREKMLEWFSGDPFALSYAKLQENHYLPVMLGKTYNFWEVPCEVGEYFLRQNNLPGAATYFNEAYTANPKAPEVLSALVIVSRRMGQPDVSARFAAELENVQRGRKK